MAKIHALAVVDSSAQIADDVEIGPFCIVEADVTLGAGTILDSHVVVKSGSVLGENNFVAQGAILGGDAQYRALNPDHQTHLKIGNRNVIREYVTIHRAIKDGSLTEVGDDCYLMAYTHIAHDCRIGNFVTMANSIGLAGHVTVEDLVTFGGMVGVHQFARIGKAAMIGGMSGISRDVPPFCIVANRDMVMDINAVGLRRAGVTQPARTALHKAVKILYKSQMSLTNAIATVRREVPSTPEVEYLLAFEERRFKGKNGRGDQP